MKKENVEKRRKGIGRVEWSGSEVQKRGKEGRVKWKG